VFDTERRVVETPASSAVDSTASERPVEYGSWKSSRTTFLTFRVFDHEVRVRRAWT